jgi:hypothetical protein
MTIVENTIGLVSTGDQSITLEIATGPVIQPQKEVNYEL